MSLVSSPFFMSNSLLVVFISANTNNYVLNTDLQDNYNWNGSSPISVEVRISSGITVGATSTSSAAFTINSFPTGSTIKIVNNGRIQGKGGNGGTGAESGSSGYNCPLGNATAGGDALAINHNISVVNASGEIWGGGGGGGGGGSGADYYGCTAGGSGGGGGAGSQVGSGGSVLGGCGTDGNPGSDGTATSGGAGGTAVTYGPQTGGAGGAGGGPGQAAASGANQNCSTSGLNLGGAAGKAINLNSYSATYIGSSGDIRGSVS